MAYIMEKLDKPEQWTWDIWFWQGKNEMPQSYSNRHHEVAPCRFEQLREIITRKGR